MILLYLCARSEVGLSRLPVTEKIAGSNPVERAKINPPSFDEGFIFIPLQLPITVALLDSSPVYNFPPLSYIVIAFIFVIKIVSMLPYIKSHQRLPATFH